MKKSPVALAVATLLSTSALAAEGLYAVADIGQSKVADVCQGTLGAGVSCTETGTGFRFGLGYQVNPNFAIEGGYLNVSEATKITDSASVPGYTISAKAKGTALQVSGIGIYPVNDTFSVFAKAGLANVKVDVSGGVTPPIPGASLSDSGTNNNLAWGLGVQFDFSQKLALRAQYEDFGKIGTASSTDKNKFTLLSSGFVVKF
ncbi:MAG: outer membrane beta-barrel protein [Gallionella sp.]|nr:outer membrane beta-barrel protein [Gallionella sp.]